MENVFGTDFDETQSKPGYQWERIRLARRLGGEMLGASVFVLPPGEKSFPYHLHRANEEFLLVLEGNIELRTPQGVQQMTTGDAALFQGGADGGHQVIKPRRLLPASSCSRPWCTRR